MGFGRIGGLVATRALYALVKGSWSMSSCFRAISRMMHLLKFNKRWLIAALLLRAPETVRIIILPKADHSSQRNQSSFVSKKSEFSDEVQAAAASDPASPLHAYKVRWSPPPAPEQNQ
jgi:hypothetical protein